MSELLECPIIVIGTHRSGTTWLGKELKKVKGLSFGEEPRHIWTRGNAYKRDDVLGATDATPRRIRSIRKAFQRFVEQDGGSRFGEKTPSNCMRIPFIDQLSRRAL